MVSNAEERSSPTPPAANPLWRGAAELARMISDGVTTSTAAVQAHLDRITLVDPTINAVTQRRFKEALKEAAAADESVAAGEPLGPFHGVPISVKEMIDVAGLATGWGTGIAEPVACHDAPAVARLKAAGAIVVVKANVPQLGLYFESDNPVHGRTNNPWSAQRTSGGSSGGDAALVGAGAVPLALGSDLGGSIRVPAHFCGVHGLMPTANSIDTRGMKWLRFGGRMDIVPGPIARTVEDLVVAYNVMADRDRLGTRSGLTRADVCRPIEVNSQQLKVGVWQGDSYFPASPAIRRAVDEAAAGLANRGIIVEPFVAPPAEEMIQLYLGLLSGDGGEKMKNALRGTVIDDRLKKMVRVAALSGILRNAIVTTAQWKGQNIEAGLLAASRRRTCAEFWRLCDQLDALRFDIASRMADGGYHAIVLPPFGLAAPPHGRSLDLLAAGSYACIANLLGWPAGVVSTTFVRDDECSDRISSQDRVVKLALRAEHGSAGLPVGVQVLAPPWQENTLAAIMLAIEADCRAPHESDWRCDP